MNKTKYTVLTYNIGNYEIVHPIKEKSDRAEYIYITDDPKFKDESGTWTVIYDSELSGSTFERCYAIRFNPFKYANTDIVLRVDGSVGINKSLDKIVDTFIEGGYDMSLMFHPTRNTMLDEYVAWISARQYPKAQAVKVLNFMQGNQGYDIKNNKGLAQMCYQIQKKDKLNEDVNRLTLAFLYLLGGVELNNDPIERVDQIFFSMLMQKYFPETKIMWVDPRIYHSKFFTWYPHHSNIPFHAIEPKDITTPYWNNTIIEKYLKPEDL